MKFRAGALEFNASVVESSQVASPQTGNVVTSMTIQFRAQKIPMHERALEAAQQCQRGGLYSLGEGGELETEWRVHESTSSYVGSQPWGINHHLWRIEQLERLACALLRLNGIELEPYDYAEQVSDDGAVRLAARALVTQDDLDAVSRLSGSIEVTRVGISELPRQMRLSGYVWGETLQGLAVVVACADLREPHVTVDGLDGALADDLEDLIAMSRIDPEDLRRRRHARRRVVSVDAWPLANSQV